MSRTQSKVKLSSDPVGEEVNPATKEKQDEVLISLNDLSQSTELLMGILSQLKIMNLHLSLLTGNTFFKGDSE